MSGITGQKGLRVQEAGKVSVKPLISADQLIAEGQPVHEASLLQPEDATETAGQIQWS